MPSVMHNGARLNPLWAAGNQIPKIILRIESESFSASICLETTKQFQDLTADVDILTIIDARQTVDSVLLGKWVLI